MWIMDAVDCSYLVTYISSCACSAPPPACASLDPSASVVSFCVSLLLLLVLRSISFFSLSISFLQFTVRWIPCHLIVLVCRRICCCFLIILVVTALYFYLSSMLSIYPLHLSFSCVRESVNEVERESRTCCRDTTRARGCHGRFRRSRSCGYCG